MFDWQWTLVEEPAVGQVVVGADALNEPVEVGATIVLDQQKAFVAYSAAKNRHGFLLAVSVARRLVLQTRGGTVVYLGGGLWAASEVLECQHFAVAFLTHLQLSVIRDRLHSIQGRIKITKSRIDNSTRVI